MDKEIWKDIKRFEQYYAISNQGRVWSKDRLTRNNGGSYIKKGRILKGVPNNKGYLRVQLKAGGKSERFFIHRLVASHFVMNLENKPDVNHIDSNPLNNKVENLEWVTHRENMHHAINKGRFNKSFAMTIEKFHKTIADSQKSVIGINIKSGLIKRFKSISEAGRVLGNPGGICICCKGKLKSSGGHFWLYENSAEWGR